MSDYCFVTDLVGFDDKIGETVIDLEGNVVIIIVYHHHHHHHHHHHNSSDRLFDDRWQKWGERNLLQPGQDPRDPGRMVVIIIMRMMLIMMIEMMIFSMAIYR